MSTLNPIPDPENSWHGEAERLRQFVNRYGASLDLSGVMYSDEVVRLHTAINKQHEWTIKELIEYLGEVYCGNVGIETGHLQSREEYLWIQQRVEEHYGPRRWKLEVSDTKHIDILNTLLFTHNLGLFFNRKFPRSKVFGLQGSESVSSAIYSVLDTCSLYGTEAVNIGMAHRGRMTLLVNLLNKSLETICTKFTEASPYIMHDVKFHAGARSYIDVYPNDHTKRTIRCSLSANPSHLELINPVVLGKTKAIQFAVGDKKKSRIVPILIHGDASFAGQGIVPETLELTQLEDYDVGGCIHLVVNNQIGFTTEARHGRSGHHCTDMAKSIQAPIFHVNGDDVEAVISVCQMAAEFRHKFKRDVVVDIVGYRRMGHSSLEDPTSTLPLLYQRIKEHPDLVSRYGNELIVRGIISPRYIIDFTQMIWEQYESEFAKAKEHVPDSTEWFSANWQGSALGLMIKSRPYNQTGVRRHVIRHVGEVLTSPPADFVLHPEVASLLRSRRRMIEGKEGISMALAEALAFGCLMTKYYESDNFGLHTTTPAVPLDFGSYTWDGALGGTTGSELDDSADAAVPLPDFVHLDNKLNTNLNDHPSVFIRMSGQDSERGTFNQRHAVIYCQKTGRSYMPLNNLGEHAASMTLCNSNLSEAAVLGYEYGFSLGNELALVLWEAQFGDFANMGQAYIDNFIASGESKWGNQSSIILLLPHGYDGQGPEHSSGRIERFLQLVDEDDYAIPGNNYIIRKEMEAGFDAIVEQIAQENASEGDEIPTSISRKVFLSGVLEKFTNIVDGNDKLAYLMFSEIMEDFCAGSDRVSKQDWCNMMSSWLQANAERDKNMKVVYPSTPAQYFHAIRRQIHRPYAKPLILFSPKYLHHHKPCSSTMDDLVYGTYFHRVITEGHQADNMRGRTRVVAPGDPEDAEEADSEGATAAAALGLAGAQGAFAGKKRLVLRTDEIKRVVFVTGKLFYGLFHARQAAQCTSIIFVRVEQIAPFPYDLVAAAILKYPKAADLVWAQEEPKNMGAWSYIKPRIDNLVVENGITGRGAIRYIGRGASANTATGSFKQHSMEQNQIIEDVFKYD